MSSSHTATLPPTYTPEYPTSYTPHSENTPKTPCYGSYASYRDMLWRQERPTTSNKTPQSVKNEAKALKRKLFSPGTNSEDEGEKKATTPKRRRSLLMGEGSPTSTSGTPNPKTAGSTPRRTVPLSERQQMVLLMQITAEEQAQGELSPRPSSPDSLASSLKRTPWEQKVNKQNNRGETSLHLAAIKGDMKQAKKLISAGADVNIRDYAGWTPLHEACIRGRLDVARQLLKAGANVNVQGMENDTPLHDASSNGHQKLVELLLRHGANPLQENSKGQSPLDVAANPDIVKLLKSELIASSSCSSSADEVRSPSPESTLSDREDDKRTDSQDSGLISSPSSTSSMKGDISRSLVAPLSPSSRCHGEKTGMVSSTSSPARSPRPITIKFQPIRNDGLNKSDSVARLRSGTRDQQYKLVMDGEGEDARQLLWPASPLSVGPSESSQDSDSFDQLAGYRRLKNGEKGVDGFSHLARTFDKNECIRATVDNSRSQCHSNKPSVQDTLEGDAQKELRIDSTTPSIPAVPIKSGHNPHGKPPAQGSHSVQSSQLHHVAHTSSGQGSQPPHSSHPQQSSHGGYSRSGQSSQPSHMSHSNHCSSAPGPHSHATHSGHPASHPSSATHSGHSAHSTLSTVHASLPAQSLYLGQRGQHSIHTPHTGHNTHTSHSGHHSSSHSRSSLVCRSSHSYPSPSSQVTSIHGPLSSVHSTQMSLSSQTTLNPSHISPGGHSSVHSSNPSNSAHGSSHKSSLNSQNPTSGCQHSSATSLGVHSSYIPQSATVTPTKRIFTTSKLDMGEGKFPSHTPGTTTALLHVAGSDTESARSRAAAVYTFDEDDEYSFEKETSKILPRLDRDISRTSPKSDKDSKVSPKSDRGSRSPKSDKDILLPKSDRDNRFLNMKHNYDRDKTAKSDKEFRNSLKSDRENNRNLSRSERENRLDKDQGATNRESVFGNDNPEYMDSEPRKELRGDPQKDQRLDSKRDREHKDYRLGKDRMDYKSEVRLDHRADQGDLKPGHHENKKEIRLDHQVGNQIDHKKEQRDNLLIDSKVNLSDSKLDCKTDYQILSEFSKRTRLDKESSDVELVKQERKDDKTDKDKDLTWMEKNEPSNKMCVDLEPSQESPAESGPCRMETGDSSKDGSLCVDAVSSASVHESCDNRVCGEVTMDVSACEPSVSTPGAGKDPAWLEQQLLERLQRTQESSMELPSEQAAQEGLLPGAQGTSDLLRDFNIGHQSPMSDRAHKSDSNRSSPKLERDLHSPRSPKSERSSSPKVPPLRIIMPPKQDGERQKKVAAKLALPYVLNPTQEGLEGEASMELGEEASTRVGIAAPLLELDAMATDSLTSTLLSGAGLVAAGLAPAPSPQSSSSATSLTTTTQSDSIARRTRNKEREMERERENKEAESRDDETSSSKSDKERTEEERNERRVTRSVFRSKQRDEPVVERGEKESMPAQVEPPVLPSTSLLLPQQETSGPNSVENMDIHPRKRKLRGREQTGPPSPTPQVICFPAPTHHEKPENPYQLYLAIRQQVAWRRREWEVVQPKPPQGYTNYLLVNGNYVLQGKASSRLNVPMLSPPNSISGEMKELFNKQEQGRYKLRLQHVIEREKLMLSNEQEIVRVHGRAARALANQGTPLSFCSILRDENTFNTIDPEQEAKKENSRTRYNGRQFLSWLQEVDDKFEKIKEGLLWRHHHEAESLNAVQKLEWQWHMLETGMCDSKSTPIVDDLCVPMVTVTDDFELLPT